MFPNRKSLKPLMNSRVKDRARSWTSLLPSCITPLPWLLYADGRQSVGVGGCCCALGSRKQLHLTTESKPPSVIQSVPCYPKECCKALTLGPSNAFVIFLPLTCCSYYYKNFISSTGRKSYLLLSQFFVYCHEFYALSPSYLWKLQNLLLFKSHEFQAHWAITTPFPRLYYLFP